MTNAASSRDRILRLGLGLAAIAGVGGTLTRIPTSTAAAPDAAWLSSMALSIVHAPGGRAAIIALIVLSLVGLCRARFALGAGTVLFLLMGLCSFAEGALESNRAAISHGVMLPGAVLAAYLIATLTRRDPLETASGVIAAAYGLACYSKLATTGLRWVDGSALALLLTERVFLLPTPTQPLVVFISTHVTICSAMMLIVLLIEASGVFFIFPKVRLPFVMCSWTLHLGVGILMGYFHIEWPILVSAVALGTTLRDRSPHRSASVIASSSS